MLVIKPDECIDCGVCEPECPVEAIIPDTDPAATKWSTSTQVRRVLAHITAKARPRPTPTPGRTAGQVREAFQPGAPQSGKQTPRPVTARVVKQFGALPVQSRRAMRPAANTQRRMGFISLPL